MAIERISPMRVHKDLVIKCLKDHPEDLAEIMPDYETAGEAIAALEAHPGEWIVNGMLQPPDDT